MSKKIYMHLLYTNKFDVAKKCKEFRKPKKKNKK